MNATLSSDDLLSRMREQIRLRRENPHGSFVTVTANEMSALVECAERLKLVAAADDKAVRELKEMYGVTVDQQAESFELMAGNKAALAKLDIL